MATDCNSRSFRCQLHGDPRRKLVADFSGGTLTSDAGVLLLDRAARAMGLFDRLAECFNDCRNPCYTVHDVRTLLGQRILGLAIGREDLNDHDQLRHDPALGTALGKVEKPRADCAPLAGKSTLNRLENAAAGIDGGKDRKIVADFAAMDRLLVDIFLDGHETPPAEIILDLDATDVPLHGDQEGGFFHGYDKECCYMPLLVFCGRQPVMARLRSAAKDAASGVEHDLDKLVRQIRARWPQVRIILRTDGGFCREAILAWCEASGVDCVIGLARNRRLQDRIARQLRRSRSRNAMTGKPSRRFTSFTWRTRDSWSRSRRVVAKAEVIAGGTFERGPKTNPRFIVTSLPASSHPAQKLYEKIHCARGDAENRVKEHKIDLFSKRCSANLFDANAFRFMLATFTFALIEKVRRALAGTKLAKAQPNTLRLRLFKIGARVRRSVRRIHIAMSSAHPDRDLFERAWDALAPPAMA